MSSLRGPGALCVPWFRRRKSYGCKIMRPSSRGTGALYVPGSGGENLPWKKSSRLRGDRHCVYVRGSGDEEPTTCVQPPSWRTLTKLSFSSGDDWPMRASGMRRLVYDFSPLPESAMARTESSNSSAAGWSIGAKFLRKIANICWGCCLQIAGAHIMCPELVH